MIKFLSIIYRAYTKIKHFLTKHIDRIRTKIIFSANNVIYSSFRTSGYPIVSVQKKGLFKIGKNFAMNNGMQGNQIGYTTPCIFIVDELCKLNIGKNVGISQTTLIAKADITIGDNVKIGGGTKIYTTDFHSLKFLERRDRRIDMTMKKCAPIILEEDCFIGSGTIILKGVRVGSKSIIGAGSVVTKNVPPNEIWAGNPAKFIRKIEEEI